jgi:hypothetical protein
MGCTLQGELDPKKAVAGIRCAGAVVIEGRQADLVDVLWIHWLAQAPTAEEQRTRLVDLTKALLQEHLVRLHPAASVHVYVSRLVSEQAACSPICCASTSYPGFAMVLLCGRMMQLQTSNKHPNTDDDQYSYPDGRLTRAHCLCLGG